MLKTVTRVIALAGICTAVVAMGGCQQAGSGHGPTFSYQFETIRLEVTGPPPVDLLLVVDNGPSMVGKQDALLESMAWLADDLECLAGTDDYHVGVITTGIESEACQVCAGPDEIGCLNPSGEGGRLQDRVSSLAGPGESDPGCRVVTRENLDCLYDPQEHTSIALVGATGCPYRRGLEAIRLALSPPLLDGWNDGFLRDDAELIVILISDAEDCGRPGDVAEGIAVVGEAICSYAALGMGPDGGSFHPDDPQQRAYALTPVEETYDFLLQLKEGRRGMVRFLAVVGVDDVADPLDTSIYFDGTDPDAPVLPACGLPDCHGDSCDALPGTRPIALAARFGLDENGYVDTLCRDPLLQPGVALPCVFVDPPRAFRLAEPILDPALASLSINGQAIPGHTCQTPGPLIACRGQGDRACGDLACVPTLTFVPPGDDEPGAGSLRLADHLDLFSLVPDRDLEIELTYAIDR